MNKTFSTSVVQTTVIKIKNGYCMKKNFDPNDEPDTSESSVLQFSIKPKQEIKTTNKANNCDAILCFKI